MPTDAVQRWQRFVATLTGLGLADLLIYADPATHVYEETGRIRSLMPVADALEHLLPDSYRRFIAKCGYPGVRVPDDLWLPEEVQLPKDLKLSPDSERPDELQDELTELGFTFLAPRAMRQVTSGLGDRHQRWTDVERERQRGTYRWTHSMFAGWDLMDVNGWAFGSSPDHPEPVVWTVEGSLPLAVEGPFPIWLDTQLSSVEARLAGLDVNDRRYLAIVLAMQEAETP